MHSLQNKGVLPERRRPGSYRHVPLCVKALLLALPPGGRQQVVVRVQGALLRRRALFAEVVIFRNAQLFDSLRGGAGTER